MIITAALLTAAGLSPLLAVFLRRRPTAPVTAPPEIPEQVTCRAPSPDKRRRCSLDLYHYGWHADTYRSWWDECWVEEVLPPAPAPEPVFKPEPVVEPVVKPVAKPKAKPKAAPLPEPELPLEWGPDPEPEPAPLVRIEAGQLATEFSERWRNNWGPYVRYEHYPAFLAQENQNLRVRRCS